MDIKRIRNIMVNQTRDTIKEEDYIKFQRDAIESAISSYNASDAQISGLIKLLSNVNLFARDKITIEDLLEILIDIDKEKNDKRVARLSKKDFS